MTVTEVRLSASPVPGKLPASPTGECPPCFLHEHRHCEKPTECVCWCRDGRRGQL